MPSVKELQQELLELRQPERAVQAARYFKTGPGQYGAGDQFLGMPMPVQRALAKKYKALPLASLETLLTSVWHEMRMTGLLIVMEQYRRADATGKTACFDFLLNHLAAMNNWDLVDVIVPGTIGDYVYAHPHERQRLQTWIRSENLWERRIALLSSFAFLRQGELSLSFGLCDQVLDDRHDLIHKAAGWMLREAGKRNQADLLTYLDRHAAIMPRTMLRYALEKLTLAQRQDFMRRRQRS